MKKLPDFNSGYLSSGPKSIKPGLAVALVMLLLVFLGVPAQAQQLDWAIQAGGSFPDGGNSITLDRDGNSYVTGFFQSIAIFGAGANATLTSAGHRDMFLAKYDSSGNLVWVRQAGGLSATVEGNDVTVDGEGNSYVTGSFQGIAIFGAGANVVTLTGVGPNDTFVAKYDNSGNLVWAKQTLNTHFFRFDNSLGIAVDEAGNSYVTGFFWGTTTFGEGSGAITLTNINFGTFFLARYDSNGNLVWVKQAGGEFADGGNSIAVDGVGNSYIIGQFVGPATFGEGANATILDAVGVNIFVARYDSNGNLVWVKQAGGPLSEAGNGIAIDGIGNSYVTGFFQGTATFGAGANVVTLTSNSHNIFVAKYDSNGNLVWVKQAGGPSSDEGQDIVVDGMGNSYVTGFFQETAIFGEGTSAVTLTSAGISDIFVAKYDSNGNLIWVKQAGGSLVDQGNSIAVNGNDNSFITGFFQGIAIFGAGPSAINLTSAGNSDIFVAKYVANSSPTADAGGSYSGDEGGNIQLDASGSADPDQDNTTLIYEWDLNYDGVNFDVDTIGIQPVVSFPDNFPARTIAVRVTDADELTDLVTISLEVTNVAPTATIANTSGDVLQGESATLAFSNQFDPSPVDTAAGFLYSYDCTDDGTFETSDVSATSFDCPYPTSGNFTARGLIKDKDGDSTSYTVGVTVLTPETVIDDVQFLVDTGVLNQGQGNALISKLQNAIEKLNQGNTNAAINQLQAFINQVNAMVGSGILLPEDGQPLIDAANKIIAILSS